MQKDSRNWTRILKDTEKIPLLYEGGIDGYWENEIRPYLPDSWIDKESAVIGYELSFMKYFYKPLVVREPKDIIADIQNIETDTDGLLASIIEGVLIMITYSEYAPTNIVWDKNNAIALEVR